MRQRLRMRRRSGERRVAIDSGGAPAGPPALLSQALVHLNADAETFANNDPVTTWTDQTGNGRNANQAVTPRRPTFKTTAGPSGGKALYFDGGDMFNMLGTWDNKQSTITAATQANPVRITTGSNHGLTTGDSVLITDVGGMTQLNNRSFTITKINDTSFDLDGEDGTGHTAYTTGGAFDDFAVGMEVFCILKNDSATPPLNQDGLWNFRGDGNITFYPWTSNPSNCYTGFFTTSRPAWDAHSTVASWHMLNMRVDTSGYKVFVDDLGIPRLDTAAATFKNTAGAVPCLGSHIDGGGSGGNPAFLGHMAELVIFPRVLTDGERTTIETYLNNKHFGGGGGGGGGGALRGTSWYAGWKDGVSVGNMPITADWQEISGLAQPFKSANSDYLFGISDGANAFLLAVDRNTGANAGKLTLGGSPTVSDMEDVASAKVGGQEYIYLADFGDNSNARATFKIFRVKEPVVTGSNFTIDAGDIEEIVCQYPPGFLPTHKDAECLIVDTNGDMYVITKREAIPGVYKLAHQASYVGTQTLGFEGDMTDIPDAHSPQATGNVVAGCISPDGERILIKNYADVYYFPRITGVDTVFAALSKPLVKEWSYVGGGRFDGTPTTKYYQHPFHEPQGEAITFGYDGKDYYTASEFHSAWGSSASAFPLIRYEMTTGPVTTIEFQDRVKPTAGYAGTLDTYTDQTAPTTVRGADTSMVSDYNATNIWRDALLKFDVSQIPPGATIVGVDLYLYINTEGQGYDFHRMLVDWHESINFNTFNGGAGGPVDANDVEASSVLFGRARATKASLDTFVGFFRHKLDVPEFELMRTTNRGLLIKATDISGGDGQQHDTREGVTPSRRPHLIARYVGGVGSAGQPGTLAPKLFTYWKMEEASGQRNDALVGARHLTDNNTVGAEAGKLGTNAALFVRANNEYLNAAPDTLFAQAKMSISCWFKVKSQPGSGAVDAFYLMGADSSDLGDQVWSVYYRLLSATYRVTLFVTTIGWNQYEIDINLGAGGLVLDSWYHLYVEWDTVAGTYKLNINNGQYVAQQTQPSESGFRTADEGFIVGAGYQGGLFRLNGVMDELAIFSDVLTTGELDYLFNSGTGKEISV